jgi:hypothetical protein
VGPAEPGVLDGMMKLDLVGTGGKAVAATNEVMK